MSEIFDLYHRWFGIPADKMPAHAYRLLEIAVFESDPAVITRAVGQRLSVLQQHMVGEHASEASDMQNELKQIEACLLNRELKSTYDQQLRQYLTAQHTVVIRFDDADSPVTPAALTSVSSTQYGPTSGRLVASAASSVQATQKPVRRGRRRQHNMAIEIAKVVIGGIIGIGLGLAVISYVRPESKIFQLFGIERTADPPADGN